MSKEVDFIKIIKALEELGCEVVEIRDIESGLKSASCALAGVYEGPHQEKISIVVQTCRK